MELARSCDASKPRRLSLRREGVITTHVNWKLCLGLAALTAVISGCDRQPRNETAEARSVYSVTGSVVEVRMAEKYVEIKHEKIPGYMAAMTMPFDVKDTNELAGLGPGDRVIFQMIVQTNDAWIENIRITEKSLKGIPTSGPFRLVREVEPLAVGDTLPEYHFTNELGLAVSTAQFKGKALVLAFVFTRCPYPTFCPLTVGNLADTQRRLKAMTNGPTNWHLLAISIDPEYDTPAVLHEYAQKFSYDPKSWSFLTGELIDVTALAEQFGMTFWHEDGNQLPSHNLRTVVVDANGKVQSIVPGNTWQPADLVKGVVKAAAAKSE
jgi:protein SCO1/2